MSAVMEALDQFRGRSLPSFPVATQQRVKVPDVIWMNPGRWEQMDKTGDPPTVAPEICVEVMPPYNSDEELRYKLGLYLEAGAEEVWLVTEEDALRFFGENEMEASELVPGFPGRV